MNIKPLVAVFALSLASTVQAGVYKCQDAQGKTTYQQTPCAAQAGERVEIQEAPTGPSGGLRESELRALGAIQAEEEARRMQRNGGYGQPTEQAPPAETTQPVVYLPRPSLPDCNSRRGDVGFSYVVCERQNREQLQRWQVRVQAAQASGAMVIEERDPNRPKPIPINDGRWLYPNGPEGNTFTGSDGGHYIRQGNQAFNPATNERVWLH